ncbi:unnamed protein product [Parajaminaea phylloscopi]
MAARTSRSAQSGPTAKGSISSWSGLLNRLPAVASRIPRPFYYLATFVASSYFLTTFLVARLAAMHTRMTEESNRKDGLKRRFQQNQNDIAFTVMALLPTLGKGIAETLDVDDVTQQLKKVGEKKTPAPAPAPAPAPPVSQPSEPTQGPAEAQGTLEASVTDVVTEASEGLQGSQQTDDQKIGIAPNAAPPGTASALDAVSEVPPSPISPEASLLNKPGSSAQADPLAFSSEPQTDGANGDGVLPNGVHSTHANGNATGEAQALSQAESEGADAAEHNEVHHSGQKSTKRAADEEVEAGDVREESVPAPVATEAEDAVEAPTPGDAPSTSMSAERAEQQQAMTKEAEDAQRQSEAARQEQMAAEEERRQVEAAALEEQLAADRKKKAELWNELKVVAISKALTTVYAINLLSVFTHVQINLLGRYAYLQSLSKDARPSEGAPSNPALTPLDPFEDAWAKANGGLPGAAGDGISAAHEDSISPETEERYLTFSWYFLHRGCLALGERVRSKVEEVMSSVPLKSQLTHAETTAILNRIKRKVEYEYEHEASFASPSGSSTPRHPQGGALLPQDGSSGFSKMAFGAESLLPNGFSGFDDESMSVSVMSATSTNRLGLRGRRKRINLLAFLLPSSPRGDLDLLTSSGILPAGERPASLRAFDPTLAALLDETRDILESADASKVLKKCVHATFDVLVDSLRAPFGLAPHPAPHVDAKGAAGPPGSHEESSRFRELRTAEEEEEVRLNSLGGRRLKLAAVLPLLARQSSLALESVPNEFVEAMATVKDLKALSAIVYSSWTTSPQ